MMDFARILKELRESHELTQEDLAKYLQVSRPTIAGYETKHREPDFDKLMKLSDYFQVSVDYLLTGKSSVELTPIPITPSTKEMDHKVITAYRNLGFQEKQDVLHYIELLEIKQKYEQLKKDPPKK